MFSISIIPWNLSFVWFMATNMSVFPNLCRAPLSVWWSSNKPRSCTEALFIVRYKRHSGIINLQMLPVKHGCFFISFPDLTKLYLLCIRWWKMSYSHEDNMKTRRWWIFACLSWSQHFWVFVWPLASVHATDVSFLPPFACKVFRQSDSFFKARIFKRVGCWLCAASLALHIDEE